MVNSAPSTPKKPKRCSSRLSSVILSPYFSPTKKSKSTPQLGGRTNHETNHTLTKEDLATNYDDGADTFTSPGIRLFQDSCEKSPITTLSETLLLRLEQLKPNLIQEKVGNDPWKLLVAVTLLNKTAGKLALPIFWDIMDKWPTPLALSNANKEDLVNLIRCLGTQNRRAERLIGFSRAYLLEPPSMYDMRPRRISSPRKTSPFFAPFKSPSLYPATPISHIPGTGPYALDSYRIFSSCHEDPGSEEWKNVMPHDKELVRFLKWKWAFFEHIEWSPTKGVVGPISDKRLTSLIEELETNDITR